MVIVFDIWAVGFSESGTRGVLVNCIYWTELL